MLVLSEQLWVEFNFNGTSGLLLWQNGAYTLKFKITCNPNLQISSVSKPAELIGFWQVSFSYKTGSHSQITLVKLMSLHKHSQKGVEYFSGTAPHQKTIQILASVLHGKKDNSCLVFLDLIQVEAMAEIKVNGKKLGILWKRPYLVDITKAVLPGTNHLEIKVTNLWSNLLIGST